jgi:4-amino-4-deoxy-L-arabinose transferase-like glycosyltransferase
MAMPRVFAHAHLAALDTFLSLFWALALFSAVAALGSRRRFAAKLWAGLALGLALLTKIHAWFLLPIVLAWVWIRHGIRRGLVDWAAWAVIGCLVFFVGWPWLWYDTAARLMRFWGTGVHRISIRVQYFGHIYGDRDVPWHYPWFYFIVTVPVGLQVLGGLGLLGAWRTRRADPFLLFLAGTISVFLVLFSSRIPVYDGERLFLLVFPPWAVLIGRGFGMVWDRVGQRCSATAARWLRPALTVVLLAQASGVAIFHPFGLSYYNLMVGGLPGAERLGLELTYWGDGVDRVLLDGLAAIAPRDSSVALAPTLYPGQGNATTTPRLLAGGIVLQDEDAASRADWLVVSRRTAYWNPAVRKCLRLGNPIITRRRQGVWLSGLWFRRGGSSPKPRPPSGQPGDKQ